MKFYRNLCEFKVNIKALILIISLLSNVCHVLSGEKGLPLVLSTCYGNSECHFSSGRCNKNMKWCECNHKYPLPFISLNVCLNYRNLGEICVQSKQCIETQNSVCLTTEGKLIESNGVDNTLINRYFIRSNGYSNNENNLKGLGHCRCKKGYKQIGNKCYPVTFSNMSCTGAYECFNIDLNSHCDKRSKRCYCDPGYVFDVDKNQCSLITKKFGYICKMDFECDNWDQNMECSSTHLKCFCKNGFDFDSITKRCKRPELQNSPESDPKYIRGSKYGHCNYGYQWDERSRECERQWRAYDYRFFSLDKFLETIVVVIFCCVTIAFLRFWRYILPQNIVESQTGMFSEFSHPNRVHRRRSSRSNSLSRRGRVIQLRLNLDSPESESLTHQATFVALPLSTSHSSLPTYESVSTTEPKIDCPDHSQPYIDEPPTYEEAMKLFETSKL